MKSSRHCWPLPCSVCRITRAFGSCYLLSPDDFDRRVGVDPAGIRACGNTFIAHADDTCRAERPLGRADHSDTQSGARGLLLGGLFFFGPLSVGAETSVASSAPATAAIA